MYWYHDFLNVGWPIPLAAIFPLLITVAIVVAYVGRFLGTPIFVIVLMVSSLIAGCLSFLQRRRISSHVTPMQRHLNDFRSLLKQQCPTPTLRPKGPQRAVEIGKVVELHNFFSSFVRDRTAYYLDANILRPLTKPDRVSYAELAGASQLQFFCSHYWGTPFVHFCDAVSKHAQTCSGSQIPVGNTTTKITTASNWRRIAYWICFCSNNQYQIEDELGHGHWEQSAFYLALHSGVVRGTCLVLDDQALPLRRSWCIFELLQTLLLEQERIKSGERLGHFKGLLLCTSSGCLNNGTGSVD